MKKIALFLSALVLAFSCAKPVEPSITLTSDAAVNVPAAGGSVNVSFETNVAWKAEIDNSVFATIQPASGEAGTMVVKVIFSENKDYDARKATLTLKAETKTAQVVFTQAAGDGLVTVDEIEYDCNAREFELAVMTNVPDFTVTSSVDWMTVKKTKGLDTYKPVIALTLNESDKAREGVLTVKAGTQTANITVTQKAFEAVFEFEESYLEIGNEGGELTYKLKTNVPYEVKFYEDYEDWFTVKQDGDTFTATVKANAEYDPRLAVFKVISKKEGHTEWVDNDWDGIAETEQPVQFYAYCYQEGHTAFAFARNLSEYGQESLSALGAIHHIGYREGYIVVSDGTNFHLFDVESGDYVTSSECPIEGVLPETMALDNAGNMIFAQAGPYCGTFDIYISTGKESPEKFISYEHNAVYSNMVSNLRVFGDLSGDAVIAAMTDLYPYCIYWEVKGGMPGEAQLFALPSAADWDNWSGIIWNANRNGCVAPLGTTADAGFLFIAYDAQYTLFHVDKAGNATPLYNYDETFGEGAGSNVNFQCISVKEWNGKLYAAVGVSSYFSWGACPDVLLFNVTDGELVSYIDNTMYDIPVNYVGGNDGENASADVCIIAEDDALGVAMIDGLNDVIYCIAYPKK